MGEQTRSILHVDMDAFYASVEQRDNPELRGKPVVVGGGTNRGVVAAASYEARRFGIHSAMPMAEAQRRCSELVRIAPAMSKYKNESHRIFSIFREFTPLVEGLSLDEAFLDVTESVTLFGSPQTIAREIKDRIRSDTSLTASVGVAENKLVAKIASDLEKPDGLVVLAPVDYGARLDPLPVRVIPGIGRKTLKRLTRINVATVRDLRFADDRDLEPIFGRFTQKTRDRAAGVDDRPVMTERREKSISAEETYDQDLTDEATIDRELLRLTERMAMRLRRAALDAGVIQVKIRQADFRTFTRQRQVRPATHGTDQIFATAQQLVQRWRTDNPGVAIRLLGVGGSSLTPTQQADLFATNDVQAHQAIDSAVDEIREKFGLASLGRARTLTRD